MWEISNTDQILTVLYSFILGIMSCLFYDIFRSIRKNVRCKNSAVFIQDIFFFIISAFFYFLFFFVRTNGEIRGYILIFALLGALFCRVTFSKPWFKLVSVIVKTLRKAFVFTAKKIDLFCGFVIKIYEKIKKSVKSFAKKTKKA